MTDIPDYIPAWLETAVRRSKGHDLSEFTGLEQYFAETQVVKSDKFDTYHYQKMRQQSPALNALSIKRFVDKPTWIDLVQDEYLGLYKAMPEINKPDDMKPTHRLNHEVLSRVRQMKAWAEMRSYTELDQWASAMAAVEFGLKLADLFDEMEELADAQKKADNQDERIRQILEQLEEMGPDGEIDKAEKLLDDLKTALDKMNEMNDKLVNLIAASGDDIKKAIKSAVEEALEEAENLQGLIESFGTEPGALQRMPAEARIKLAHRIQNNRRLKELAEKVGRFVRLALSEQATKIIHATEEVYDLTLGADLDRLAASELVMLTNPTLKREFYRRYSERELHQYLLRGTEKVARGAIICCVDSSGSMSGAPDTWARAVAIALLNIAAKQNRDFYGIIFGSAQEIKQFYFPKGKGTPQEVLDFAEFSFMGGTDFMEPLGRAVTVLERQFNDDHAQKGDIVMITDGECAISDEWRDRFWNAKERLGFRLYSCLIGVHAGTLQPISDLMYNILDFAQGGDVKEIFGYV